MATDNSPLDDEEFPFSDVSPEEIMDVLHARLQRLEVHCFIKETDDFLIFDLDGVSTMPMSTAFPIADELLKWYDNGAKSEELEDEFF